MAGHELVAVALPRYHYRLQDAVPADRGRELVDPLAVELGPRLLRVRRDLLQGDLARRRCEDRRRTRGRSTEQHVEAAAQSGSSHQAEPASAIGSRSRSLCSISRARSLYAFAAREEGS